MIPNKAATYIMTNSRNTVLYVGSTNNLKRRVNEHKRLRKGFASRYNITKLVYYELESDLALVRKREKQIKNLLRRKKEILINSLNHGREDLDNRSTTHGGMLS